MFMATHEISRRIQHIIQLVYDAEYPSKKRILSFLEKKDCFISNRTLERYFESIRTDFGLEILYSKAYNGYYIDDAKSIKVTSFFKFLEIATIADIFTESLRDSKKLFEYVSFDNSKSFKGIGNLKHILIAITQKRKLKFVHENFHNNTIKKYEIIPFLLKEYENRWYVIGVPDNINEIRTFGIDRVTEVSVGKLAKLKKKAFQEQLKAFDTIIGLNYNSGEPTKIRLLVSSVRAKYLRSLPLHTSQIVHSKNKKGEFFADFFLTPNYEFKMQLLKMGDEAVVVEPTELKKEMKNILQSILKKYK